MSYPPASLPPAQPYRPSGQPAHVARHVSQTQRHHPYRDTSRGPTDPPDGHDAYRYDERPATYDQYNGGSPSYQAQSPLPGRPHPPPPPPQEYPPSAGTSPHTPAQLPGHPHAPPPPHPAYHEVPAPGYHQQPPSTLYSASTYGNVNGQGLDPSELPNDLSALADAHPGQKPPYPYSTIIRYAIQGSPRQRLTLSELYETMEARFPWFKTAGSGWKNSVRHNLSLNRCFEKVPRPITEPGKGSYWTVNLNGPEGTRRVRKRRSKKAKAEGEAAGDVNQGTSATDTASASAPTPSPPPQVPVTNGSPLPPPPQNGQNGSYPPNWSNDERWQQQPPAPQQQPPPPTQNGYLPYPPPPGQDAYSTNAANPAVFNRQPSGGYPQQQAPQQQRPMTGSSWPHQPAAPPSWPRPRNDAAPQTSVPPTYPLPPPPTNNGQRPLSSAAQSDTSG